MAAGDSVDFTTDITGLLRSQQHVRRRQFRGLAGPAHGHITSKGHEFFRRLAAAGLKRCPDGRGRDAIDADTLGNQLLRQPLNEDRDRPLPENLSRQHVHYAGAKRSTCYIAFRHQVYRPASERFLAFCNGVGVALRYARMGSNLSACRAGFSPPTQFTAAYLKYALHKTGAETAVGVYCCAKEGTTCPRKRGTWHPTPPTPCHLPRFSPPTRPAALPPARTNKDEPVDYDDPAVVLTGPKNEWIYWEIPHPETGHVYSIYWSW